MRDEFFEFPFPHLVAHKICEALGKEDPYGCEFFCDPNKPGEVNVNFDIQSPEDGKFYHYKITVEGPVIWDEWIGDLDEFDKLWQKQRKVR